MRDSYLSEVIENSLAQSAGRRWGEGNFILVGDRSFIITANRSAASFRTGTEKVRFPCDTRGMEIDSRLKISPDFLSQVRGNVILSHRRRICFSML